MGKRAASFDPLDNARSVMEAVFGDISDKKALRKAIAEAKRLKKKRQSKRAKAKAQRR